MTRNGFLLAIFLFASHSSSLIGQDNTQYDYGGGDYGNFGSDYGQNGLYNYGDIVVNPGGNAGSGFNLPPVPPRIPGKKDPEQERAEKAEREKQRAEKEKQLQALIVLKLKNNILSLNDIELARALHKGLKSVFKARPIHNASPGHIIRVRGDVRILMAYDDGVIATFGNRWFWMERNLKNSPSVVKQSRDSLQAQNILSVDYLAVRGEADSHFGFVPGRRGTIGRMHYIRLYNVESRMSADDREELTNLVEEELAKRKLAKALRKVKKMRIWEDTSGKFRVRATFVELVDGKAVLKKQDGKVINVSLEKLCEEDRSLLKDL
ncbi:MAG: SHD1 domain-containing protein [Pirellulales bacterium]|nr:SHD1 domain-containing protein [Pirellulales bacterium]